MLNFCRKYFSGLSLCLEWSGILHISAKINANISNHCWNIVFNKADVTEGIAEFAELEFAGLENDGLENGGVEQEQTYILHRKKNCNVYDM